MTRNTSTGEHYGPRSSQRARSIKDVNELEVIRDITEKLVPDLIVIDLDMPDGSSGEFVLAFASEIRHQSVYPDHRGYAGSNMDVVKKAVDAGVDDLLATNFRKGNTWANRRLNYQSNAACRNQRLYCPDHRKRDRSEGFSDVIPLFHVPNTLRDKGFLSHNMTES